MEVDVLVNNAGVVAIGQFESYDLEQYHSLLQLNINAFAELCWLYLPSMKIRAESSMWHPLRRFCPFLIQLVCAASKSYVLSFSESLFGELFGTDVTVTCCAPAEQKRIWQKKRYQSFSKLWIRALWYSWQLSQGGYKDLFKRKKYCCFRASEILS